MSVGKGSLLRASKVQNEDTATKTVTAGTSTSKTTTAAKTTKKKTVKKVSVEEEKVTPAVVTASVITSGDSVHEKKFEAISKITCDLPTYLL